MLLHLILISNLGAWISQSQGATSLMMTGVSKDKYNSASTEKNESGPNYFSYYKHLVLDQISQVGDCSMGETEEVFTDDEGGKISYRYDSNSYFTGAVGKGLSEFKKERLLATLNESVVCLNREADEMLDHILATLQIDSRKKEHLNAILDEDEDLMVPFKNRKRKAHSSNTKHFGSNPSSVRQVYDNNQVFQGKDGASLDVGKYKCQLLAKLDIMDGNLEDYLNIIVSKCRPMTDIEKHQLGKKLRKLPEEAFDRVIEILQPCKFSAKELPDSIFVNLEEQDNVKLWRLCYYVELVLKANKL